jgi:hypothetical protein
MKYDDAEYYFLNFETELPNENGGRHIGLFLEWAIRRGFASASLMQHADALRRGATNGVDILFDECDGKLMDQDLNDEGNAFATAVYDAHVLKDFIEAMNLKPDAEVDAIFGADFTVQRQRRVLWELDRRYSDWRRQFGLPDKDALLERLLSVIRPAAEAAGFPLVPDIAWGSHERRATFARSGPWGVQQFHIAAVDGPGWFYGARVELRVHIPALHKAIYAEKTADLFNVTSLQDSARIPFIRFAETYDGPVDDYSNDPGFWVFRDDAIEPLAQWLAQRLRSFALPLLRGLDGIDALALEYGKKPATASPIHEPRDPYAALLSAEMARHPRLGAMLDEAEQAIREVPQGKLFFEEQGALKLIPRIRQRSRALLG